ncbi:MAG: hypothetical protein SFU98_07730 [Leptospiraceae bacterium]|nr:hypothetical protein [Leptospiraceae bacterium]
MNTEKNSSITRKILTGITIPALDPVEFHSIELGSEEMPVVKAPKKYSSEEKYIPISLSYESVEAIPLEITNPSTTGTKLTPSKGVFEVTKSYTALPIFEIKKFNL